MIIYLAFAAPIVAYLTALLATYAVVDGCLHWRAAYRRLREKGDGPCL